MDTSDPAPAEDPPPSPAGFAEELRRAFGRRRPQGSIRWNFSGAFDRLEREYGSGAHPMPGREVAEKVTELPGGDDPPERSVFRRLADRVVVDRLRSWVDVRASAAAARVADQALARQDVWVAEGLGTAVEAFRFLSARVEVLETTADRCREPVGGSFWLVDPPDLAPWEAPLAEWLGESHRGGAVLHAECGDGALSAALAASGLPVRCAEPRGTYAWKAAARGLPVRLGPALDALVEEPPGSLGGIVLSGVVDRSPLDDLIGLVAVARDRLEPGGSVVVIGTRPETAAASWGERAHDLLPGRPLHATTWELVLDQSGFGEVHVLAGPPEAPTYAVAGVRGR